ncbi:M23 family metallopeptidase [Curtobacterium sp. 458]|uniref:M23 family metallopeptidase n=1 Tax=Curtobacterium sp. 458 TaxID=3050069 RepID=UPI0025B4204C|nr:M23 family metallopeptidase [Curtobacterium sp. 458]WJY01130.1 M23 family metallopeptidase [Curtobacterium sp. 458]
MTTAPHPDQHPETPVVHLSRRAALEAERAASRKQPRRTGRTAATAGATTEHASAAHTETRIRRVDRDVTGPTTARPAAVATTPQGRRPLRTRVNPLRPANRASRVTLTSALAAFVLFAASATPAHAASGTAVATATLAPSVAGQDYSVTQLAALADPARDGFTIGGGSTTKEQATASGSVSFGGEVRSPFPGPVQMSSGFGYRSAPCGACSSLHEGLDFTPGLGTPIGAIAKGTVRVAGTYFNYGTAVVIDHVIDGRKVATLYGHMIPGSTPLKVGDTVEAGEFIGQVGNSGVSTGAHLHLEVLLDGVTPIDPAAWLEARTGRPITA